MDRKKIIIISFTEQGSRCNAKLTELLPQKGYFCEGYTVERFAEIYNLRPKDGNLKEWIAAQWGSCAFLFIGAAGIAIRLTAPCIRDKYTDSAVLVMDEQGKFVIPLLSGHLGGAVEIAEDVAEYTKAIPVITTATDVEKKFAVDVFAAKNQLFITDREKAKEISAAVLEGRRVGFFCAYPLHGQIPVELDLCQKREELSEYQYGIEISALEHMVKSPETTGEKTQILYLFPRDLAVGIGCRKGISTEKLWRELTKLFEAKSWEIERIFALSSIDLKQKEIGLLELSRKQKIPFFTYSAEELKEITKVSSRSEFVEAVTGIDNVCERAARRCCPEGELLLPKTKLDQVTVSVIRRKTEIIF